MTIIIDIGRDHFFLFAAQITAQDCGIAFFQHGLVYPEFIRINFILYDHFSQTVAGGHKNNITKAGLGIVSKHDAAAGVVTVDHFLYGGGKRDLLMGKLMLNAMTNGVIIEQRGEYGANRVQQFILALNIQTGFLLPDEGGFRKTLDDDGRTHGKGNLIIIFFRQLSAGLTQILFDDGREGSV